MMKNLLRMLMVMCLSVMGASSFADTSSNGFVGPQFRDNPDGSRTLYGHVPSAVALSKFHHHADANEQLDLRIMVPLANQSELDGVLKGLYDPTSPIYHHFLSSSQFDQQFRASDSDLNAIKAYLGAKGLVVTSQSGNGTVLHVAASVGAVENTFGVHINYYSKNDGTMFRAPDSNPTISAEMVGKISAIGGMDNLAKFKQHLIQSSSLQAVGSQAVAANNIGTGPGGYLAPSDVKTAYNLNAIPTINDPSSLQNVALFELDGYLASDITNYETHFNLPTNSVTLQNVLIDGFNGQPTYNGGNVEVTVDIEEMIGIAPWSINKLYVYEAPNTIQAWQDEWNKIASDDVAKVVSCSWGLAEYESPTVTSDNLVFQKMAAQGQQVFVASGDCGAYDDCSTKTLVTDEPASQPYATGVGISVLSVNSGETYKSETASSIGGGGISMYQSIPSYQKAMAALATKASMVSQTMRNVPDVSFNADPSTSYAFYLTTASNSSGWYGVAGSSIAAPIWAAFTAEVNQGRVHAGEAVLGFINPTIYNLAGSSSYGNDFHDITTGNNQYYPAAAGLDDATGLGSFNGANLYNDLVSSASSGGASSAPQAPAGLSAVAGTNQVALTWSLSVGATSYTVKRATVSGGPYQSISTQTGMSYTDVSVSAGTTYYYVVSATNSVGTSANSSQVSVVPVPAIPAQPTGLQALPGNNQASLTWNASAGATSYNLRRGTGSSGPWTIILSGTTKTSYVDSGVLNGGTYYYTVSAVNAGGESSYVNVFQITLPPSAPAGLSTVPGNKQIALSWSASSGAVSYNVKRSTTSGGPYTTISTSGALTVTNYIDSTVTAGTTYYYVVSAVNAGGQGANSVQVSSASVSNAPAAPTGLTGISGDKKVVLSWNASSGATSYNVQRSTVSNASFTTIATVSSPGYTDTNVSNGYNYYYEVNAVNANGQSSNTSEIYIVPAGLPVAPTTVSAVAGNAQAVVSFSGFNANGSVITSFTVTSSPGGITAVGSASPITVSGLVNGTTYTFTVKATNGVGTGLVSSASNSVTPLPPPPGVPTGLQGAPGNGKVVLTWTGSLGAVSYHVKKSLSNGGYTTVATVSSPTYTDSAVTNGTTYFYVVSALNSSGSESANSSMVEVVPYAPLAGPVMTATAGAGNVSLSWTTIPETESYYVGRSTTSGGPYTIITSTSTNSFKDTSVASGVNYYYVVEAYVMVNGTGQFSLFSAQVKATPAVPVPSSPAELSAVSGNDQVSLTWSASSGATTYNVKRSTSSGGVYTTLASVSSTSYTDSTVVNGTIYYYVVSAVNSSGESANSSSVSATPASPSAVAAVTSLTETQTSYMGQPAISLQWKQSSSPNLQYNNLYYSIGSGSFTKLAKIQAATAATIVGVGYGTTYNFYVTAVNSSGVESPASNKVIVIPTH